MVNVTIYNCYTNNKYKGRHPFGGMLNTETKKVSLMANS